MPIEGGPAGFGVIVRCFVEGSRTPMAAQRGTERCGPDSIPRPAFERGKLRGRYGAFRIRVIPRGSSGKRMSTVYIPASSFVSIDDPLR